ncbi:hypothetical protein [Aeromonas dhakensis]|uniref:hypothetical protein n=1 Tax=Aeromonas dhakensis TaxID=196024 RepID=UPI003BA0DCBD
MSKVALGLIGAATVLLGAAPWWSAILVPLAERQFGIKVSDPSVPLGLLLISIAVILTLLEMLRLYKSELAKNTGTSISKQLQEAHSDDAFIRLRIEAEKSAVATLRRLIEKHLSVYKSAPVLGQLGSRVQYGDETAVYQYIDTIVVGQLEDKVKQDFFSMVGDSTGQPLAYKFVRIYEGLNKEAIKKNKAHLIHGTPLHQAFINITHPAMTSLRKAAYWDAYV